MAVGAALAVFLGIVPVIGGPVLAILAAFALLNVARRRTLKSAWFSTGVFVGAGLFFVYGLVSTIAACSGTTDFCGQTPLLPLAVLATVSVGLGTVCAAIALRIAGR